MGDKKVKQERSVKRVKRQRLPGIDVKNDGSTWPHIRSRLCGARADFISKKGLWTKLNSQNNKVKAWARYVQPKVMHGCRAVHLDKKKMEYIRKWERWCLRSLIK